MFAQLQYVHRTYPGRCQIDISDVSKPQMLSR